MKTSGIYCIEISRPDGPTRFYIGQSCDVVGRQQNHLGRLRRGIHGNAILLASFRKYGEDSFRFFILLVCEKNKDILSMYEQAVLDFHVDAYGPDNICNIHRTCVNSRIGVRSSEETRRRQSASLRGRCPSPETLEKMRRVNLGKKLSPEAIAKRTAKQRGRVASAETRARQSAAMTGKIASPETCAKISLGRSGWKPSEDHLDHLRRLAANNTGKPRPAHVVAAVVATKLAKKKLREEMATRLDRCAAGRDTQPTL